MPSSLHILSKGVASRFPRFRILEQGAVWGDEHLLLRAWWMLDDVTAVSLTFVEVLTIDRELFSEICEDHPQDHKYLRRCVVKWAVYRGVIYEARRRLHEEGDGTSEHQFGKLRSTTEELRTKLQNVDTDCADWTQPLRHRLNTRRQ